VLKIAPIPEKEGAPRPPPLGHPHPRAVYVPLTQTTDRENENDLRLGMSKSVVNMLLPLVDATLKGFLES
jgi:hypothetical protein